MTYNEDAQLSHLFPRPIIIARYENLVTLLTNNNLSYFRPQTAVVSIFSPANLHINIH